MCVCVGHRGGGWVQAIISSFLSAWASLSRDFAAAAAAKSLQSGPTLCDPIDGSPPGSPVPGILQARTLEWAAISFSNAGKRKVKVKFLSRVRLLATPWTAAHQALRPWDFPGKSTGVRVPLPSSYNCIQQCNCNDHDDYSIKISSALCW